MEDPRPIIPSTRKAQRLTQAELSESAGLSRRALVAIEGGGDCTLSTLRRLFHVLDMDIQATPVRRKPPTLEDVYAENALLALNNRRRES